MLAIIIPAVSAFIEERTVPSDRETTIPPGWVGGFAESNPGFAYPDPDLTSLPMLENMANIDLLQRQQAVLWPEFTWETVPGDPDSRCFQMFAPDISRLGYTDTGRVYSIICPQQGACSPTWGCLNVEVSVTGQRGWVDETNKTLAADMTVEGKIWFTPTSRQGSLQKTIWGWFSRCGYPFPATKADAIRVSTHKHNDPDQPIFPVRTGEVTRFKSPDFAKHPEAWAIGNVEVEIGPIAKTGYGAVDAFNDLVMSAFNTASGNMLKVGNLLSWNVWFTAPELVDTTEWRDHAEKWRESIDADHGSPTGPGTPPRYFDGSSFPRVALHAEEAGLQVEAQEQDDVAQYLAEYLPQLMRESAEGS